MSQPSATNPKVHFDHKTTFCASPTPLLVPIKSSQELALVSQEKRGSCSFPAPEAEDIYLQGVFLRMQKGKGTPYPQLSALYLYKTTSLTSKTTGNLMPEFLKSLKEAHLDLWVCGVKLIPSYSQVSLHYGKSCSQSRKSISQNFEGSL